MGGEFKGGERLPAEAKLASKYGVGRSTIREALRVLSHMGKIETRTGSGSVVLDESVNEPFEESGMTLDEVADIYQFRYSLEIGAAEKAAEKRNKSQLKKIKVLLEKAKRQVEAHNLREASITDTDLHIAILEAGGYQFAAKIYRANREALECAFRVLVTKTGALVPNSSVYAVQRLHDELVFAIERGDKKAAERSVRRDLNEVNIRVKLASRKP